MNKLKSEANNSLVQVHGKGLFSKEEVTVSIRKSENVNGIVFVLKDQQIIADVSNVLNVTRNTTLSNGIESICLVEHFLAACSLLGVNNIEVETNTNELVFEDGSALHWKKALIDSKLNNETVEKYDLKEALFVKEGNKEIAAIPHDGFKVSYYLDWSHPALGKLFCSWQKTDDVEKVLRARTFATKEENDFFGVSDRLLTLTENSFNKELYEPLEPCFHKILDIIGDLRLCGINPLEINMHIIGFKSGHALNVQLAKELKQQFFPNPV